LIGFVGVTMFGRVFGVLHQVGACLPGFLIEAAREGCDLNTAEGRAHLASNAKPMWSQLPEGALKRQLLTEIAELVQLGSQGNRFVAGPGCSRRQIRQAGFGFYRRLAEPARPSCVAWAPAATGPAGRWILLTHADAWGSSDDHHLLCELPAPSRCSPGSTASTMTTAPARSVLREALRDHEDYAVAGGAGPARDRERPASDGILAERSAVAVKK
jgi:DNA primase